MSVATIPGQTAADAPPPSSGYSLHDADLDVDAADPRRAVAGTRVITGADDITSTGHLARGADLGDPDRARPVSAACGPSARAWSTSASRA